jgi:hypothetical protein
MTMKHLMIFIWLIAGSLTAWSQIDSVLVRGLCIAAPAVEEVDRFVQFINEELSKLKVNTLVLRVDYRYAYESHPELRSENPLSRMDVKKMVDACKRHGINLIPQVNLLGHQSWAGTIGNLLKHYPQFDETPEVQMPEEYKWPNPDGLYCKSYCPLHPQVHGVVFAIVDEIMAAFEATAFHAGMDEVFYIGEKQCPRCNGRDPAELFAGEVTKIRNHLALNDRQLWIWGDRLIDGKTTGIGLWEASLNNTHQAIDIIPKDVMINDWHYVRADPTPHYFALKGFNVIICPWNRPQVGLDQLEDYYAFKKHAHKTTAARYLGMMQTYWGSASDFMNIYYQTPDASTEPRNTGAVDCFKAVFARMMEE